ncbi:hypothetical protein HK096_010649 [Nowakowskiella sp. JEL0078]|nr:hypothetical protein HK096_010649 [Nowakowskiella sp. JEL0078]
MVVPPVIAFLTFGYSITSISGRSMQPTLNPDTDPSFIKRDIVLLDRISFILANAVRSFEPDDYFVFPKTNRMGAIVVGDVVLLSAPHDPKLTLIKRVVALEGDWVLPKRFLVKNNKDSDSQYLRHWISRPFFNRLSQSLKDSSEISNKEYFGQKIIKGWPIRPGIVDVASFWNCYKFRNASKNFRSHDPKLSTDFLIQIPKGYVWLESDEPYFGTDSNHFGPVPLGLITKRVSHILFPISRFGKLKRKYPNPGRVFNRKEFDEYDMDEVIEYCDPVTQELSRFLLLPSLDLPART